MTEILPERLAPRFGATLKLTLPGPGLVPKVGPPPGKTMCGIRNGNGVSHGSLNVGVQAQPAPVLTKNVPKPPFDPNACPDGEIENVQEGTIGFAINKSPTTHESFVVEKVRLVIGCVEMKPTNVVFPTVGKVGIEKTCPLDSVIVPEPTPENPNPPISSPTAKVGWVRAMKSVLFGLG